MEMNKGVLAIAVVVILIAAVAGFALISLTKEEEKTADVRIGYLTGDLHQLSRVVAMNTTVGGGQSMLQKNHINVTTPMPGGYAVGGDIMTAFASDAIDIGYLGAPPAILRCINADTNITIVAQVNNEGSAILVKPDINSFKDLDQKTVATPGVASIQHLLLLELAAENGMNVTLSGAGTSPNTVYYTQVSPALIKGSLESNAIQGAVSWEPYCSDSILAGTAKVLNWSSELWPGHPCCTIAVKTTFLNAHPTIVENFLRAHVQANKWMADAIEDGEGQNYELLLEMAEQFSNRNESVVVHAMQHIIYTYNITPEFENGLKTFTQAMLDLNMITSTKMAQRGYSSVDDFVSKFVDDQYLNKVK